MTHDELARRRPLWSAMSELFLDTEVRWAVPGIARKCVESGHDDEALERIFWAEVFPKAIGNLTQVAGEWTGLNLDEAALIKRANSGSIPWLTRRAHGGLVQREWLAVREVAGWLRAIPLERRELHARALTLLSHRYFAAHTDEAFGELVELAREEWRRAEPLFRRLLEEDEAATHDARVARISAALG